MISSPIKTTLFTCVLTVVYLVFCRVGTATNVPTEWTKEDYPNPTVNITGCGNNATSLICDPNRLTSQSEGM